MRVPSVELRDPRRRGMRASRRSAAVPPRRGAFPKGTTSLCSGRRSARKASLPSAERPTQPPRGCGGSRGMNAHAGPAKRMPGRRGKKTHTRVRRSSHRSASAVSVSTAKAALCSLLLPSSLQTRSAGLCKEPAASREAAMPGRFPPGRLSGGIFLLSRFLFPPSLAAQRKGTAGGNASGVQARRVRRLSRRCSTGGHRCR